MTSIAASQISTIDQLLEAIATPDVDYEAVFDRVSKELFAFNIEIEGDPYDGNLPGNLLQGLSEFQTALFRSYALFATGKSDLRGIDKDSLWLSFTVTRGCTAISAVPPEAYGFLERIFKNMSPIERITAFFLIFLAFATPYVSNHFLSVENEKTKRLQTSEVQQTLREQSKDATDIANKAIDGLTKAALKNAETSKVITQELARYSDEGCESVIRCAKNANKIAMRNRVYTADEIAKIQSPETQPVTNKTISGHYKIIQTNTENPDLCRVILKDKEGNKISASFIVAELFGDDVQRIKTFLNYQRDEVWLDVTLAVTVRPSSTSYAIIQVNPITE